VFVPEDTQWIDALKQRDPAALSSVFEAYADKIYRLAVSLLHDEQSADGVVQDTFIKLIEHVDGFEGRASISTWLYRVAYNECMMRLRRQRPQLELDRLDDGEAFMPSNLTSWGDLPDVAVLEGEAAAEMRKAVEKLSPSLRTVFTLRDVEELSIRETAQILQISESAVKVRLHRARLQLREHLAGYFDDRASASPKS
jgi:RNA polymerase sigma-70 factor (ECF subfamily)